MVKSTWAREYFIAGVDENWKNPVGDGTGGSAIERYNKMKNELRLHYELLESPERIENSLPTKLVVLHNRESTKVMQDVKLLAEKQGIHARDMGSIPSECIGQFYNKLVRVV